MIGIRVKVGGARLYTRIAGDGPIDRNALLLHGGGPGTCGDGWTGLIGAGFGGRRLYAPDFIGFGESDVPADAEYGQARFVADSIALIDTLCLAPVVLVGHSMGAGVAATIAVTRPDLVSHLVLIAPGGGTYGLKYRSPGMETIGAVADDPSAANVRALVELMSDRPDLYDGEVAKRMALIARPGLLDVQRRLDRGRKAAAAAVAAPAADRAAIGHRLRSATLPILLLWGEEERFNPFALGEQIRDALPPHAQYRVIPGAGHNVQYDQPQAVADALDAFLGR